MNFITHDNFVFRTKTNKKLIRKMEIIYEIIVLIFFWFINNLSAEFYPVKYEDKMLDYIENHPMETIET